MKILITGGQGMVGRNIREHPAAASHEIIAPSRQDLNLLNRTATRDYVARVAPDSIIHCAGRVGGIQANMAYPADFLTENLDMGINIVRAAEDAGVPKLLNLGSSCMYPRDAINPLSEDVILTGQLEPTNEGYALAKIVVARLCDYISRGSPDLHYRTLVPCNLYGFHDKFDPKVSHLLPAIIRKVHEAKANDDPTVEIWGDGTARREFMFAADLSDAIWFLLDKIENLDETTNIGVGDDYSINDYYRIAADVIGWNGNFVHDLSRATGMQQKLVSVKRQTDLGWAPSTSLEDGIRKTYAHFKEFHLD